MVASLARWGDQAKLVNLTTRLKGSAYSFYRACTPEQRASYPLLVKELSKRFVPVRIEAIQSGLFHERRQKKSETVDDYAQDLRRLYQKAYARAQRGNPAAEAMGKSVLAYQSVSGLLPELKAKVAGTDGDFEHQLTKARFEEAKARELAAATKASKNQAENPKLPAEPPKDNQRISTPTNLDHIKCRKCGMYGHYKRNCRYMTSSREREAHGRSNSAANTVTAVMTTPVSGQSAQQRVLALKEQLREAEKEAAIEEAAARMNAITTGRKGTLGPIPTAAIHVNGVTTRALLDTGSPSTIASLKFVMKVLEQERPKYESLQQWKEAAKVRIEPPPLELSLKNYGGEELDLAGQIEVQMSVPGHAVQAMIQVHREPPVDLLLGTDLQSALGFSLIQIGEDDVAIDLLQGGQWRRGVTTTPAELESLVEEPTKPAHTVCLLQATRVPPCYKKLVRCRVQGVKTVPMSLFEPVEMSKVGVMMEEAMVETEQGSCITLVVENPGYEPLCLKKGLQLGSLEPVEGVVPPSCAEEAVSSDENHCDEEQESVQSHSVVAAVSPESGPGRIQRLLEVLKLEDADLPPEQHQKLEQLIRENADVFALDPSELGSTDLVVHSIDTGSHPPIRQLPRRMPFSLRHKVTELIQEMLDNHVIESSKSPWASPVVLVRKKDKSIRFCVDYRKLNSMTKLDVFPLPRIDDTLDLLSQNKFFSTLDLASGYWQVKVEPKSREKTAFVTSSGLYEFVSMPFGLCNAPATFQRLMEVVMQGLARECCMVYLDDILVMGRTFEEHLENLQKVFSRLRKAKLTLKPRKCLFVRNEVEYLGHIVSKDGVAADPSKIRAVREFPRPTDVKSLRSFLGLASYYRRFIPQFSKIAGPLFALTRNGVAFDWTDSCEATFKHLKQLLTQSPVLAFPNFEKDFLLETNASTSGLGAVLAQKHDGKVRPIAYASRTLQVHEKNYGISELEALGVVWAIKHFRHYLYGHHCDVYTDHVALKSLLNTPQPSGKLARWGMAIQELDLQILHRSGKKNSNADALSRYPLSTEETPDPAPFGILAAITPVLEVEDSPFPKLQREDADLAEIIDYLETGTLPTDQKRAREVALVGSQYVLKDGTLYHLERDKTLRVVPPTSARRKLFDEAHAGAFGGHLRAGKIHSELGRHYWWPKMRADIFHWTRACLTCATRQPGRAVKAPLTPIPVAGAFDRVGVDIIQYPTSNHGNKYAVVFVDYLTKWPEVFAVPDQTAHTTAELLVKQIISRHGVPAELLSDRGANFLSGLIEEVCELMGIHRLNTTAYHPQTDGLVERFNCTLTSMLAKTVAANGADWDEKLPYVLFAYRAAAQESSQESPFFLMYGRDPRLPTETALSVPTE